MKAAVLSALGAPLTIQDVPDPVLGTGEVIVEVVASKVLAYAREVFSGARKYVFPLPFIPGTGAVGRVVALGRDAAELAVGDWVFCDPTVRSRDNPLSPTIILQGLTAADERGLSLQRYARDGSWAELLRVPTENAFRLGGADAIDPADPTQAARWLTLGTSLVSYGGLTAGQLGAGETVVINGATGAFGSAAVAVALALGAGTVLATGRNGAVLERIVDGNSARLGAPSGSRVRAVVMSGEAAVDHQRILAAAPRPIDLVLDLLPPAAAPSQVTAALTAVRPGGRVVLMGGVSGELAIPYAWLMRNNITVRGQWMFPREAVPRAIALAHAGLLPLDTAELRSFPLAQVNEAIAYAAERGGPFHGAVICPRA